MTPDQFLARCPHLWHVGAPGTFESISANGLRTAAQSIAAADLDEEARTVLNTTPREESIQLIVDGATVTLRDQLPLLKGDLEKALEPGVTPSDWVQVLNRRCYLFTDRARMQTMLEKYATLEGGQEVIAFSPLRLFDAAGPKIELSAQNAGATARKADVPKGRDTFVSVTRFPNKKPAEITLVDGLEDLTGIIVRAERLDADGTRTTLR